MGRVHIRRYDGSYVLGQAEPPEPRRVVAMCGRPAPPEIVEDYQAADATCASCRNSLYGDALGKLQHAALILGRLGTNAERIGAIARANGSPPLQATLPWPPR